MLVMKKYVLSAFAALAIALAFGVPASALTLAPASTTVNAKPGQTAATAVKLTNNENAPVTLRPAATLFTPAAGDESGTPQLLGDASGTAADWVVFKEQSVTVAPGQSLEVPVLISVPADAAGGTYNLAVVWSSLGEAGGEGVAVQSGVTSLMLLDVDGPGRSLSGTLTSFSTLGSSDRYSRLPVGFALRVTNTGNTAFKPQGTVSIRDAFGRTVETLSLNESRGDTGYVAPNSTRKFEVQWKDGFALGKYTAVAEVAIGSSAQMAQATFWVLPTGLMALWLIIAVVIIAILIMLIRNMMMSMKK